METLTRGRVYLLAHGHMDGPPADEAPPAVDQADKNLTTFLLDLADLLAPRLDVTRAAALEGMAALYEATASGRDGRLRLAAEACRVLAAIERQHAHELGGG